jgi:hypothetical protein
MKLPELLPPRDLLERLGGVAEGLRSHARLGRVPVVFGVAAAIVQVFAALEGAGLIAKWREATGAIRAWVQEGTPPSLDWTVAASAALVVAAVVIWSTWRSWLREADTPLRYTFSIATFVPADERSNDPRLAWLAHDLATALSRRIPRLTAMAPEQVGEALASSHFHVAGSVVIRRYLSRRVVVDIAPRVRLGAPGAPEIVAPLVRYRLQGTLRDPRGGRPEKDYARILERIAYSVASAIYARLREDVAAKVAALPARAHRAAAYLREAEDWARSSTLNGYDDALALLRRAMAEADPRRRGGLPALCATLIDPLVPVLARIWPGAARRALLLARIETAFARTVALRELQRIVVSVTAPGREQRATPYAARMEAEGAIARLAALPARVPGRDAALQDAHAALSMVQSRLGARISAYEAAMAARDVDPVRFETDPMCQYARGDAEASPQARLRLFRRVLQLDPRHEKAQLLLAYETELRWREDTALDADAAERIVLPEYERLLDLNGGATAGHANAGYVRWLLGGTDPTQIERAIDLFEEGLAAHELEPASAALEMRFGLGRALAEQGRLAEAQGHLLEGLAALAGDHAPYDAGFRPYLFADASEAVMERFALARRRVEEHAARASSAVADAVLAMALLDEAEAALARFDATGDPVAERAAETAWRQAGARSSENILYAFLGLRRLASVAQDRLETVLEVRAPQWAAAVLLRADRHAAAASRHLYQAALARIRNEPVPDATVYDAAEHLRLSRQLYHFLLPQAWLWRGMGVDDAALPVLRRPWRHALRQRWLEEVDPIGVEAIATIAMRALGHAESLRALGRRRLSGRAGAHSTGWPAGIEGLAPVDRAEARHWYRTGNMLIAVSRLLYETDRVVEDWREDAGLRQRWIGRNSRAAPGRLDSAMRLANWAQDALAVHARRIVRAAEIPPAALAELLRASGRIPGAETAMDDARFRLDAWIDAQARLAPSEPATLRLRDLSERLDRSTETPWRCALQLRAAAARGGGALLAWLPDAVVLGQAADGDATRLAREAAWLGLLHPGFATPRAIGVPHVDTLRDGAVRP